MRLTPTLPGHSARSAGASRRRRWTVGTPVALRIVLPVAVLGAVRPAALAAQVRVVDEGTFTVYVAGERVGREDFSIRAVPGTAGASYVAQGNVLIGTTRVAVAMSTDSSGFPVRYSLEASQEGRVVETVSGEANRGIWLGRAHRDSGESAREFRLPAGTVAAELRVAHQLWFALRRGGGALRVLLPRSLAMADVMVEDAGPDRVTLGLQDIVTRRWVLRPTSGTMPIHEAWTDLEGRVLRLRVPALDLEALRDEPPPDTPETGMRDLPYEPPEPSPF